MFVAVFVAISLHWPALTFKFLWWFGWWTYYLTSSWLDMQTFCVLYLSIHWSLRYAIRRLLLRQRRPAWSRSEICWGNWTQKKTCINLHPRNNLKTVAGQVIFSIVAQILVCALHADNLQICLKLFVIVWTWTTGKHKGLLQSLAPSPRCHLAVKMRRWSQRIYSESSTWCQQQRPEQERRCK